MKQVILIHAHRDLDQLNALVDLLLHDDLLVWVNLDAKSALDPGRVHPRARLVARRIAIHWGQFSQVQATLNSLAEIHAGVPAFDKVVFISAQDFPLLPNARLVAELARLRGCELLDNIPIGPGGWDCAERFAYFHSPAGARAPALWRAASRCMRAAGIKRRMPRGWRPYGGSSWWSLSRACTAMILSLCARDPSIGRFFRSVACPDELFFQTLVMNSPFRGRVIANNFRFIAWPGTGAARNPRILGLPDYEPIRDCDAHFCRKLDPVASAGLLARLLQLRQARDA